ncbi:hypothetical protein CRG98_017611 [Punica granatum]|uniref:Uncharacterized protein n=1 Tax=Punica granatum TaxID=22663 RepID=A0A2I0K094_PUNGR|nr:hypothetical protein CRG98_017611 [Punica granatum]
MRIKLWLDAAKPRLRNLNEPNIAISHVNECSDDSAPREPVLSRLGIQSGINRPRSPIAPLCIVVLVSVGFLSCAGLLARRPSPKTVNWRRPRDSRAGLSRCSSNVSRRSGTVVISVFHDCAPKARFPVSFTCQWVGPPGAQSEKASVRVWGTPRPKQDTSETRPDASLVTLAPGEIFRVPYWAPFDASVI